MEFFEWDGGSISLASDVDMLLGKNSTILFLCSVSSLGERSIIYVYSCDFAGSAIL